MLSISGVSKSYGNHLAVDDLSLEVQPGTVVGFLGPNGAGKTTTISMITGLISPDKGTITLLDGAPHEPDSRKHLGVAPQSLALYEALTAQDNLRFFGKMYGLKGKSLTSAVADALELTDLTDRKDDRVEAFSGGMKRRLNLAVAMIHKPKLLLLDEPTVGVDPQSRNALLDSVLKLRDEGHTIIYTTHYMEEAQKICDKVIIMDKGKLLAEGSLAGLLREHGGEYVIEINHDDRIEKFLTTDPLQTMTDMELDPGSDFIHVRPPDLEQVFFNLTGKQLRD
jgi:ABC-2 type transport system ATP-binding protein